MSKFILVKNNRVTHVEDTRPEDALPWIEVDNDLVQPSWWRDSQTLELFEYRPYSINEVRDMRNELLKETDWMVLPDSRYQEANQSSNLALIETYRQSLRDFPNPDTSYNENNLNFPTFPVLS